MNFPWTPSLPLSSAYWMNGSSNPPLAHDCAFQNYFNLLGLGKLREKHQKLKLQKAKLKQCGRHYLLRMRTGRERYWRSKLATVKKCWKLVLPNRCEEIKLPQVKDGKHSSYPMKGGSRLIFVPANHQPMYTENRILISCPDFTQSISPSELNIRY